MAHSPTIGTALALAVLSVVACATPNKYHPTDATADGTAPTTDSPVGAPMDKPVAPGISPDVLGPEQPAERGDTALAADTALDGAAEIPGTLGDGGACSTNSVTAEVCDGKDNDCDGRIDEDLTQDCSNACGSGTRRCLNGRWEESQCPKTPTDSDPLACGQTCEPCRTYPNATPVCRSGQCGFECRNGNYAKKCSQGCYECCADTDCIPRENHEVRCVSNQCSYSCSGTTCGSQCVPRALCHALYGYSCGDADPWGTPCKQGSCDAPGEVRAVAAKGETKAEIIAVCDAELPKLARAICASNPAAQGELALGQEVRISFYVGLYDRNGVRVDSFKPTMGAYFCKP